MNKRINIQFNDEFYRYIEETAKQNSMSLSSTVKLMVAQYRQQEEAMNTIKQAYDMAIMQQLNSKKDD